jgi:hypothetical protein
MASFLAAMAAGFFLFVPGAHAQQHSDALFCRAMQEIAEKHNRETGSKVDAYTVVVGMAVLCSTKVVDFRKKLLVSFRLMNVGWQARKQAQWNQIYCEPGSGFRQAIDAGWTISHTLTDVDGVRHYMVATCR